MKRLIVALLAILLVAVSPAYAQTQDWVSLAKTVRDSIVEIASANGACTGFIINSTAKNDKDNVDYVLTAAHCEGANLVADLQPATIKAKDFKNDLMVLEIPNTDRTALKLADKDAAVGEEVASYGYGYALDQPMFRVAHVSAKDINIGERVQYQAIDSPFVKGQSGGPVVNSKGEVVLVVQLGSESVGFGVGAEKIQDRVGRYFEKVVK